VKKVFYEKVGRRYVPVAEYNTEIMHSFPQGASLVICQPGVQSFRYSIDPDYAAMIAAGCAAEDAICQAIHEQSQASPVKPALTKRQRAAWEEMKAAFGDEMFSINFSSTRDIAQAGIRAMQQEADKLLKNPTVKQAYEQFLLVSKLTKESNLI